MSNLFDRYGNFIGAIPAECVAECTRPGKDATPFVDAWRKRLDFQVPRELAVKYLDDFGAWDDLDTAPDDRLAERILWIACGDIQDGGEWCGLIH